MELSWSTFLFEIVNFLVLVWILIHFLYRPVLNVIAKRRGEIEDRLAESRRLHEAAEQLKTEYESRLGDWNTERQQLRDNLAQQLDEERARQMAALRANLENEQERTRSAQARQHAEAAREAEHLALQQGARFATRLLGLAAGPELEARLIDLALDDLAALTAERITTIRKQWGKPPEGIQVSSAYPLDEDRRQRLEQVLRDVFGIDLPLRCQQKPELMAGLRIHVGAWVLHANVHDELAGFVESSHDAR